MFKFNLSLMVRDSVFERVERKLSMLENNLADIAGCYFKSSGSLISFICIHEKIASRDEATTSDRAEISFGNCTPFILPYTHSVSSWKLSTVKLQTKVEKYDAENNN